MRKLLYITDQEEYSDNGTISSLFDKYLKEYWEVDIVFITKYKHSFQRKGNHLIVPAKERANIMEYLSKRSDLSQYDFVMVRNKKRVLKNVLKHKEKYDYKVGYRISYPKKHHKLELATGYSPVSIYQKFQYKRKISQRDELVNKCDLFMPSSVQAHEEFYPNINIESFPIWVCMDPDNVKKHKFADNKVKNFVHVGAIDKLRNFDVVLDAFELIKNEEWHLNLITKRKEYVNNLLRMYPMIRGKITVTEKVYTLDELRDEVDKSDIGLSVLPSLRFYDTVIADKVMNYCDCAIPTLMSSNAKNHSVFEENEAFFTDFDSTKISEVLRSLIAMSSKELAEVGGNAQSKLLKLNRNYKILAKDLAEEMNRIIEK